MPEKSRAVPLMGQATAWRGSVATILERALKHTERQNGAKQCSAIQDACDRLTTYYPTTAHVFLSERWDWQDWISLLSRPLGVGIPQLKAMVE
eukprot:5623390-Pyramimonas_sp.AAC.1